MPRWTIQLDDDHPLMRLTGCGKCGCKVGEKKHYIMLTIPRSGSTMLHNIICQHPNISCIDEPLHKKELKPRGLFGDPIDSIMQHLHKSVNKLDCYQMHGAKIFTEHLSDANISLYDVIKTLKQPKIVLLYRRNILDSFVSLKSSQHSRIWNTFKSESPKTVPFNGPKMKPPPTQNISLSYKEFEHWRNLMKVTWKKPLKVFHNYTNHLKTVVTYTDITENGHETIPKLFKFLGFESEYFEPLTFKQNPHSLEQKIPNYSEFMTQLKENNISMYLDVENINV
ncbi:unnamed protein product [Owenia fusiformis]|uniref:Uncharacterized protein n=1 Tax=Owenia fusiformis TaxID=6347 RepID=A0A8J1U272_OWEFU|nr:unnamed protein product [Owenia fusiformis]